jgi:hypothetical protein
MLCPSLSGTCPEDSVQDNKEWVGGLFCDLSKAFDYVNHDILLDKVKIYGITGPAYKLIKSYLSNRCQRVKI